MTETKRLEHLGFGIRECLYDGNEHWHDGNKKTGASEAGEPCILPVFPQTSYCNSPPEANLVSPRGGESFFRTLQEVT